MVPGGQAVEGSIWEKVGYCGDNSAGDVQGWDSSGGDRLGNNGPTSEREGGVQGHWSSIVVVEGAPS